jgi:hypothetical protein
MPASAIEAVRRLEDASLQYEQAGIVTEHSFHSGMYARTIKIPAGVLLTGVLIKIPTMLVFSGDAVVYTATGPEQWTGYRVVLAPAHRKQAFLAHEDTYLTMVFPTTATTVEEAEAEFTDEAERLLSRRQED